MRKAADLAVALGRRSKIEKGKRVGFGRTGLDACGAQQMLTHQMRKTPRRIAHADVDAGLAKMRRQQLRVAIGEVQQTYIAEGRRIVKRLGYLRM